MPSITFTNMAGLGLDLRKGLSVSDSNRPIVLKNAYTTTGQAAQKRPGLVKVADLEPGTKGLFAAFGKLNTFYDTGTLVHANALFQANKLVSSVGSVGLVDVTYAEVFNGFIYVACRYISSSLIQEHHYLDGTAITGITDPNCPHTPAVIKLATKLFAVGTDPKGLVHFSATNDARNWTFVDTAPDAGFLDFGANSRGDRMPLGLGTYQGKLVVLSKDGAQVWTVDADPANNKLDNVIENVGTSHPRTIANVAGDLLFLSDYGFRSITTLQLNNNLADIDVGSPIDSLVRLQLKTPAIRPRATYFYGSGQYLCAFGDSVFIYSISRTAKIAAWSEYELPFTVDAFAELGQTLYLRTGNAVYRLDPDVQTDNGAAYEVIVQTPYMDFKTPGILKQLTGADVVMEGAAEFSIGYDVRDPTAWTEEVHVEGNTRPGGLLPMACSGTEFSLRFRNFDAKLWRLDACTINFERLA
jgi:hypothetical protein